MTALCPFWLQANYKTAEQKMATRIIITPALCPQFELGKIVATPGALRVCSRQRMIECLALHAGGDWGVIEGEDAQRNDEAVTTGRRIMSAYPIDPGKRSLGFAENTLWIVTAADRSQTAIQILGD